MSRKARPLKAKKLLVAKLGAAALTFAACAAFPGCNLLPPPSCEEQPSQYQCRDLSGASEDLANNPPTDGPAPVVDGATRD